MLAMSTATATYGTIGTDTHDAQARTGALSVKREHPLERLAYDP